MNKSKSNITEQEFMFAEGDHVDNAYLLKEAVEFVNPSAKVEIESFNYYTIVTITIERLESVNPA